MGAQAPALREFSRQEQGGGRKVRGQQWGERGDWSRWRIRYFFPNEYLNGNKEAENEDPKDNSNEETGKGGQQDSLDTDSEPCRKAKKTAKMRIQSSSGENASESNVSDFDDDYAATGTKKKGDTFERS